MTKTRYFKAPVRRACAATMLVLLAGCTIFPETESPMVYALPETQIVDQQPAASSGQRWTLTVQTPYSNSMLNSNRIVVQPDSSELSVYKGARWTDSAPVLLRNRLVNAFRAQSSIAAVGNDNVHVTSELEFGGDLNRFQVEYQNGVPVVHIQLDAFLMNPITANLLASQRFSVQQPVNGQAVPDVTLAFGEATDRLAVDVVSWVLMHSPSGVKGR